LKLALAERKLVGDALYSRPGILEKSRGPSHNRIGKPEGVDAPRDRPSDPSRRLGRILDPHEIAQEQSRRPRIDRLERDVHVGELVGGDPEKRWTYP
jgi:hypothetical protein